MATRAIINFVEREDGVSFSEHPSVDKIHMQMYHHYDGYPSGLGVKLASYLDGFNVVNGISLDLQGLIANGMGCLAAQLVGHLKEEPGNVYLQKPRELGWEDYQYFIWVKEYNDLWISIFNHKDECVFVGKPNKLINKYEYDR